MSAAAHVVLMSRRTTPKKVRASLENPRCQAVGSFVEALQRAHVGARYADRDIEDLQQVRADIRGIAQPLQDGVDLLPSCGVERIPESGSLSFAIALPLQAVTRGPYRGRGLPPAKLGDYRHFRHARQRNLIQ